MFILITTFLFSFCCYWFFKTDFFSRLGIRFMNKKEVQTIHSGEVMRLGGLVIFLSFSYFILLTPFKEIKNILLLTQLTSLPFFLAALKEDVFRNVHYFKRFFAILISASLFIYFYHYDWPRISFPGFEYINHHPVLLNLFYILVIAGITNGANIIDGMNGLSALKFFSAVSCILILAMKSQDQTFILISILMLGIASVFLFFNFPYAQIFLGDSGAYFLGFMSIANFIVFYGRHAEFSNWGIAVALFYYIFEVLFSILRKLIAKKSPMKPDSYHLHLLTFKLLVKHYNLGELKSNPATTLVLSGYFILPPLFFLIFPPEKIYMGVSFFFLFVVYLLQYFYTHLRVKKLSK